MKMLAFVISLGVLYWAMTSYANVRLAAAPCTGPANVSSIGHVAEAPAEAEFQVAQIEPAAGAPICAR